MTTFNFADRFISNGQVSTTDPADRPLDKPVETCAPMTASSNGISEVIERYSQNTADVQGEHVIPYYKWKDLFQYGCAACSLPRFAIVDSAHLPVNASIWLDQDHNLRIKTHSGLRFKGFLKAYFDKNVDYSCYSINTEPKFVALDFEICGLENVYAVDPNAALNYKFLMGVDQDEFLTHEVLRSHFKTDSQNCGLSDDFRLVTNNDGTDYPLSPNLMGRFGLAPTGIKLINYLGAELTVTVYIRGSSTGNQGAYKKLVISYVQNDSPVVSGDIQLNRVEVREDDDNTG